MSLLASGDNTKVIQEVIRHLKLLVNRNRSPACQSRERYRLLSPAILPSHELEQSKPATISAR